MLTFALGVTLFTVIVSLLVGMILMARSQLVSTGNVEITINGDPALVGAVTALPARGALELSAGIVEFVGFAPDRPDDVLRLTLRSALGPPGLGEDGVPPKIIRAEHWIESR